MSRTPNCINLISSSLNIINFFSLGKFQTPIVKLSYRGWWQYSKAMKIDLSMQQLSLPASVSLHSKCLLNQGRIVEIVNQRVNHWISPFWLGTNSFCACSSMGCSNTLRPRLFWTCPLTLQDRWTSTHQQTSWRWRWTSDVRDTRLSGWASVRIQRRTSISNRGSPCCSSVLICLASLAGSTTQWSHV